MDITALHRWDLSEAEAVALQRELAARLDTSTPLGAYELVAGADVSNNLYSNTVYAGVVLFRRSDWSVVERCGAVGEARLPYIPGLLSFREAPVLLEAFRRLEHRPDVVVIDGQGIAHPRRLGIAAHLGLWLRLPCVGCAKSKLWGRYQQPGPQPGASSPLTDQGEIIGRVLRSKVRCNPLFISPGHHIDLDSSVRVVQDTLKGYRLPEPTRQAHDYVNALRRGDLT
jgi:deoxyribonuclease V